MANKTSNVRWRPCNNSEHVSCKRSLEAASRQNVEGFHGWKSLLLHLVVQITAKLRTQTEEYLALGDLLNHSRPPPNGSTGFIAVCLWGFRYPAGAIHVATLTYVAAVISCMKLFYYWWWTSVYVVELFYVLLNGAGIVLIVFSSAFWAPAVRCWIQLAAAYTSILFKHYWLLAIWCYILHFSCLSVNSI